MCGRFTQGVAQGLIEHIGENIDFDWGELEIDPSFNVSPSQPIWAVLREAGAERARLARLRWGIVPSWSKEPPGANAPINARSETIFEKPTFRAAIRARRCLIPADGFFEWKAEREEPFFGEGGGRGAKRPYYFHLPGRRPFAFAGIWERWKGPDGTAVDTCALLTAAANEVMKPYHHRMPVLLRPGDYRLWCDPAVSDPERIKPLFASPLCDRLEVRAVGLRVNNPRNNGPTCIEEA